MSEDKAPVALSEKAPVALQEEGLLEKLHSETAKISWLELQRFFAQGSVLLVANHLDLVKTATWLTQDNKGALEDVIKQGHLAAPSNDMARHWFTHQTELWSVVVAPFVLVQEPKPSVTNLTTKETNQ